MLLHLLHGDPDEAGGAMTETPRLEIDRSIGAAYIHLSDEPVARTVELARNIQVDIDATGAAVGVELLNWTLPEPETAEFDCRGWRCRSTPGGDVCCPSCDCSMMNSTVSTEQVETAFASGGQTKQMGPRPTLSGSGSGTDWRPDTAACIKGISRVVTDA